MKLETGSHTWKVMERPKKVAGHSNTEAFSGFSHIFSPDCLNNILFSQGCVLEKSPPTPHGSSGQKLHSKDRGRGEET